MQLKKSLFKRFYDEFIKGKYNTLYREEFVCTRFFNKILQPYFNFVVSRLFVLWVKCIYKPIAWILGIIFRFIISPILNLIKFLIKFLFLIKKIFRIRLKIVYFFNKFYDKIIKKIFLKYLFKLVFIVKKVISKIMGWIIKIDVIFIYLCLLGLLFYSFNFNKYSYFFLLNLCFLGVFFFFLAIKCNAYFSSFTKIFINNYHFIKVIIFQTIHTIVTLIYKFFVFSFFGILSLPVLIPIVFIQPVWHFFRGIKLFIHKRFLLRWEQNNEVYVDFMIFSFWAVVFLCICVYYITVTVWMGYIYPHIPHVFFWEDYYLYGHYLHDIEKRY